MAEVEALQQQKLQLEEDIRAATASQANEVAVAEETTKVAEGEEPKRGLQQAEEMLEVLPIRFGMCHLPLHPFAA